MRVLLPVLFMVSFAGCRDDPPHPSQQQIDLAEKHALQAVEQADRARVDLKHVERLREIDRVTLDSQSTQMQTARAVYTIWLLTFTLLLMALLIWLAREIRLRRILSHVLMSLRQGGDP
jgi:hypothetical protein